MLHNLKNVINDFGVSDSTINRLANWIHYDLNRTLLDVDSHVSSLDNKQENIGFPDAAYDPLEKLDAKLIEWVSSSLIYLYFSNTMAVKGHDKEKQLFLREFLKNCTFYQRDVDIFIKSKCSAETKTAVDYEVQIQLNYYERNTIKAECKCPAGKGPRAACKHVGALFFAIEYYGITGNSSRFEFYYELIKIFVQ